MMGINIIRWFIILNYDQNSLGFFVQLHMMSVSRCSLTAQKYMPLSSGEEFFTVKDPLSATVLFAENLTSLNS